MSKMTLKEAKILKGIKGFWPNFFFTIRSREFIRIFLLFILLIIILGIIAIVLQVLKFDFSIFTQIGK